MKSLENDQTFLSSPLRSSIKDLLSSSHYQQGCLSIYMAIIIALLHYIRFTSFYGYYILLYSKNMLFYRILGSWWFFILEKLKLNICKDEC